MQLVEEISRENRCIISEADVGELQIAKRGRTGWVRSDIADAFVYGLFKNKGVRNVNDRK